MKRAAGIRTPSNSTSSSPMRKRRRTMKMAAPGSRSEQMGDRGVGLGATTLDQFRNGIGLLATVGRDASEVIFPPALGVRGDEGAFALMTDEKIFVGQFVDRFPDRTLTHAEARGKVDLAWDGRAGTPLAGHQTLRDEGFDLPVKRLEGGRSDGFLHGNDCKQIQNIESRLFISFILYKTIDTPLRGPQDSASLSAGLSSAEFSDLKRAGSSPQTCQPRRLHVPN